MLTKNLIQAYRAFSRAGIGHIVGQYAQNCLSAARTFVAFNIMKDAGYVRISCEPEQENYFDVYGEPDTERERKRIEDLLERWGCWYVYAEVKCLHCNSWETVDGIGMCIYPDPTLPFDNDSVIDLMQSAIDKCNENAANLTDER